MNIVTELYQSSANRLPKTGKYILASQTEHDLIVYQAYKPAIADYAVKHQILGGPDFSYQRMSWIKPNFLWMMYRCGWASKKDQERVLAIWINKMHFEKIISCAVLSSFDPAYHTNYEQWQNDLALKDVRMQWDPDHDPFGGKLQRRAIQLGLKNAALEEFGKHQIQRIEDVTDFVKTQKKALDNYGINQLLVPAETIFIPGDPMLNNKLRLS
jgi:hypothetical protein